MDIDSSGSTLISTNNNEGKKCSCAVFSFAEDYKNRIELMIKVE